MAQCLASRSVLVTRSSADRRQTVAPTQRTVPRESKPSIFSRVGLLGAAAAAAASLTMVQPASADFPGFKDILPGNPEKSSEGAAAVGNDAGLNEEDVKKTGAKPIGPTGVENAVAGDPAKASKGSQLAPSSGEKKERVSEFQNTLKDSPPADKDVPNALE